MGTMVPVGVGYKDRVRVVEGRGGKPGKGPGPPKTAVVAKMAVVVGMPLVISDKGGISESVAVKVASGRTLVEAPEATGAGVPAAGGAPGGAADDAGAGAPEAGGGAGADAEGDAALF